MAGTCQRVGNQRPSVDCQSPGATAASEPWGRVALALSRVDSIARPSSDSQASRTRRTICAASCRSISEPRSDDTAPSPSARRPRRRRARLAPIVCRSEPSVQFRFGSCLGDVLTRIDEFTPRPDHPHTLGQIGRMLVGPLLKRFEHPFIRGTCSEKANPAHHLHRQHRVQEWPDRSFASEPVDAGAQGCGRAMGKTHTFQPEDEVELSDRFKLLTVIEIPVALSAASGVMPSSITAARRAPGEKGSGWCDRCSAWQRTGRPGDRKTLNLSLGSLDAQSGTCGRPCPLPETRSDTGYRQLIFGLTEVDSSKITSRWPRSPAYPRMSRLDQKLG